jgi:hypothetical protein
MRRYRLIEVAMAAGLIALGSSIARAESYSARLSGFHEVGGLGAGETGAILTDGTGTLQVDLDRKSKTATYTLTFSGLTSAAQQAHIHFGKAHVAGGIVVWLCQTTAKPSPVAGTPFCPIAGGTVSGTITPASIIAVPGQNVTAGDFDALTDALTSNTAYANVHTASFPAGEIRGQVRKDEKRDGPGHD